MKLRTFSICLATLAILRIAGASESKEACRARCPPGPAHGRHGGPALVLAEYQVWHGLPSHGAAWSGAPWLPNPGRPYDSRDPVVIARHIASARAMGIDGFVVNWYGKPDGVLNDAERAFMDEATAEVFRQAEAQGFRVALLYDEGTVTQAGLTCPGGPVPGNPCELRVIRDLSDAAPYFCSPAYLRLDRKPALFVFPYAEVDRSLGWSTIRGALSGEVTLLDQDPDPGDPSHDAVFDGFYAWVKPGAGGWDPAGREWGRDYLRWFYDTMRSRRYRDKIAVGGAWPGFDDSLAPWGTLRYMARNGGRTYDATLDLAAHARVPIVLIATWNDFEEGTDIELGVEMVLDMERSSPELRMRSSPLQVAWDPSRGEASLQVYLGGACIYEATHAPGVHLALASGSAYEIKTWFAGCQGPLARTVTIRREDRVPGTAPIDVSSGPGCP